MIVRVLLNEGEGHWFGYDERTAQLIPAVTHETIDGVEDTDVLELLFEELNIGETSDLAKEYRSRGFRSLSVGDVAVLGDRWYACDSFGWRKL